MRKISASAGSVLVGKRAGYQVGRMPWEQCRVAALAPHLDWFEHSEADHLEPSSLEFGDFCIRAGVYDDASQNAVSLKIV